jgi:hypothetical protein
MTGRDDITGELAQIEQALIASRVAAPKELRTKVMSRVHGELAASPRREFEEYLAYAAAMVLLLFNFTFSAAQSAPAAAAEKIDPVQVATVRDQILSLQLDLPSSETARLSLMLLAGRNLRPSGIPYGGPVQLDWLER